MQGDLINGRTPEYIKTSLAAHGSESAESCADCEYSNAPRLDCSEALCADALIYIERLEAAQPKWISVEERLPEGRCLYWDGFNPVRVAESTAQIELASGKKVCLSDVTFDMLLSIVHSKEGWDNCTHILYWMPLPEPPEVEE